MKTLFISVLLIYLDISDSFFLSRRRRTPQPVPKDCVLSEWQTVVKCSKDCGPSGVEMQKRTIVVEGRNGGRLCSTYELERTVPCNRVCYNEGTLNIAESRCDCPTGYTGECCGQDVNECSQDPSPCDHICVNEQGSFSCRCRDNYTLDTDNISCIDAKECQRTPPPCAHRCRELDGGYSCYCEDGYELADDQKNCNDINECKTGSLCQYRCKNTPGDYECECQSGYFRNSDNKTCTDIDECSQYNGGCKQECENLVGGFRCRCGPGYVLASDNISCNDLDECATHGETLCEQLCLNIPGSYKCGCILPYTLNADLRTCSCNGDKAACDEARDEAEAQRNTGSDKDTVYNWIIGVLILVCLVLLMSLALLCYRKGYYRLLAPKPPPISTIPRRHNNIIFTPDLGDDDAASGVYEDPDDVHYEVLPEVGPSYMQMSEPDCKQTNERSNQAAENHYVENDYCNPGPPTSPGGPSLEGPSTSSEGPVYVEGDSTARPPQEEGAYSARVQAGPTTGFDHEEDDYQNNPPFYDNI
ncbi:hypothetical protein ACHWQZ_G019441 [Mnemiopsis leidyi]